MGCWAEILGLYCLLDHGCVGKGSCALPPIYTTKAEFERSDYLCGGTYHAQLRVRAARPRPRENNPTGFSFS
jgi:hypothetical protein